MKKAALRISLLLTLVAAALSTSSCETKTYDHTPPPGKGSIVVDNNSGSDTELYLNGSFVGKAESGDVTVFDISPGQYRLVLAETDGYRNYRDYVDVLENRLTILDVMTDYSSSSLYYVVVDFE